MPVNWKLLHSDLNKFRANLSFNELAREWEIPASTFTRIKQGKRVGVDTVLRVVAGMEQDMGRYVSHSKRVVR